MYLLGLVYIIISFSLWSLISGLKSVFVLDRSSANIEQRYPALAGGLVKDDLIFMRAIVFANAYRDSSSAR